jgi:hypothetical protein
MQSRTVPIADGLPALRYHVGAIVHVCAKEQMIVGNAPAVVALVKDAQFIRYRTVREPPRHTVRARLLPIKTKLPISRTEATGIPLQARRAHSWPNLGGQLCL